jgi:hypothetical protein
MNYENWDDTDETLPLSPMPSDEPLMTPIPGLRPHPLIAFDTRTPDELKKQIKAAEDTAKFFKSHWVFFYLSTAFALWRGYTQRQTEKAIKRLASKK